MKSFADYYEALMNDQEAMLSWKKFVTDRVSLGSVLECACGHGDLAYLLAHEGYQVDAFDLDEGMIQKANLRHQHPHLNFSCANMLDLSTFKHYDAIVCFGDSLNYLDNLDEVHVFIKECLLHLTEDGVLMFDMHTDLRLAEFMEPYIEEGIVLDTPYQWSIETHMPHHILHTFAFYEEATRTELFRFKQTVFDYDKIKHILDELKTHYDVKYDFMYDTKGESEKIFFTVRKQA